MLSQMQSEKINSCIDEWLCGLIGLKPVYYNLGTRALWKGKHVVGGLTLHILI